MPGTDMSAIKVMTLALYIGLILYVFEMFFGIAAVKLPNAITTELARIYH